MTISFCDFRSLLLFADVAFPRFVYADITSETVAFHIRNNVSVFVKDAPAKRAPTMSSFKIGQVFFPDFSNGLSPNTITNALTRALRSVNKRKNVQCCQTKSFNVDNTNSIPQFLGVFILFTPCAYQVS
jgi:hypothetical protein